jgi:hypothetical protein
MSDRLKPESVTGLAGIRNFAARKASAEFRHLVWVIAAGLLLIVPPAALWLPKLTVSIAADFAPFSLVSSELQLINPQESLQRSPDVTPSINRDSQGSTLQARPSEKWLDANLLVGVCYLLITLLLSLRLVRRVAVAQAWIWRMDPYFDAEMEATVGQIATVTNRRGRLQKL